MKLVKNLSVINRYLDRHKYQINKSRLETRMFHVKLPNLSVSLISALRLRTALMSHPVESLAVNKNIELEMSTFSEQVPSRSFF